MDMESIALVRATNIIPKEGIIKPISNDYYLEKNTNNLLANKMSDLLKELKIIPPIDYSKITLDGYFEQMAKLANTILKEYIPFTSNYNSCVLFSLNGICPDDSEHGFENNIFSNKSCGIIEPLKYHINEVISLVPTDTAIKGNVYLSKDAIILIKEDVYNLLTDMEKEQLNNLSLKIKIFNSSLSEAIEKELLAQGFAAETLTLTRPLEGYKPTESSKSLLKTIKDVATNYDIPQVLYFNLLTQEHHNSRLKDMDKEIDKSLIVQNYYLRIFLEKLLPFLGLKNELDNLMYNLDNPNLYQKIIDKIKLIGIEQCKLFLDNYNHDLRLAKDNKMLLTPEEIIEENNIIKK